jgi:chromosome segregation ATPase
LGLLQAKLAADLLETEKEVVQLRVRINELESAAAAAAIEADQTNAAGMAELERSLRELESAKRKLAVQTAALSTSAAELEKLIAIQALQAATEEARVKLVRDLQRVTAELEVKAGQLDQARLQMEMLERERALLTAQVAKMSIAPPPVVLTKAQAPDDRWNKAAVRREEAERLKVEQKLKIAVADLAQCRVELSNCNTTLATERQKTKAANDVYEKEKWKLQDRISTLDAAKLSLHNQLDDATAKFNLQQHEVHALEARARTAEARLSVHEEANARLQAALEEAQTALNFSIQQANEARMNAVITEDTTVADQLAYQQRQRTLNELIAALEEAARNLQNAKEALALSESEKEELIHRSETVEKHLQTAHAETNKWKSRCGEFERDLRATQKQLDSALEELGQYKSNMQGKSVDAALHEQMIQARDARIIQLEADLEHAHMLLEHATVLPDQLFGSNGAASDQAELEALQAELAAAITREKMVQTELDTLRNQRSTSAAAAAAAMQAELARFQARIHDLEAELAGVNRRDGMAEIAAKDELIAALLGEIDSFKQQLQYSEHHRYIALEQGIAMASKHMARRDRHSAAAATAAAAAAANQRRANEAARSSQQGRKVIRRLTHYPITPTQDDPERANFHVKVCTTPAAERLGAAGLEVWVRVDYDVVQLLNQDGSCLASWPSRSLQNIVTDKQLAGEDERRERSNGSDAEGIQGGEWNLIKFDVPAAGGAVKGEVESFAFTGRTVEVARTMKRVLQQATTARSRNRSSNRRSSSTTKKGAAPARIFSRAVAT